MSSLACATTHETSLMSSSATRPSSEPATIPGPAGTLEAIVDTPPGTDGTRAAVICHPHPMYGGTLTNKVVHMLARSCNELGVPSVRFNFRGVGASTGRFDEGEGETEDALAALDWVATRWPGASLWLGGFSFGGAIAIRAAAARDVRRLVTVAPAIQRVPIGSSALPRCPWLIVQGDNDELVDAGEIERWAGALAVRPQLALLRGVDHFFHGRLNELRSVVLDWLRQLEDVGQ
jgi:alpha/beta superfamily hydrolase